MAKIPTKLKQIAADLGCNVINYLTTTKEGEVFSLAATDDQGNYLPIGQPILYACNDGACIELPELRVDEILSNLKE